MRFTKNDRTVLTLWGCERRDLTIERLAWAAAYMVAPEGKSMICSARDKLINDWSDAHYSLYYRNMIYPHQGLDRKNLQAGRRGDPA